MALKTHPDGLSRVGAMLGWWVLVAVAASLAPNSALERASRLSPRFGIDVI